MMIQQHDGVVVKEERGNPGGLRQVPRERRTWERGRAAPELGCGCPPPTLLYIGPQGGRRPWEMQSPKGAAARGVECPPRQVVRPPHLGFPTLGAGGGPRGAPQPTKGWFPSHFSPWGPPG